MDFVHWKLPKESTFKSMMGTPKIIGAQVSPILGRKGFLLFPFNATNSSVFFWEGDYKTHSLPKSSFPENTCSIDLIDEGKDAYYRNGNALISAVANGHFEKVVLSRRIEVQGTLDSKTCFAAMCHMYPDAFVYHYRINDVEWLGASPELFLNVDNEKVASFSLAGTRLNSGNSDVPWPSKEQNEQQYVTDFVLDAFIKSGLTDIQVHDSVKHSAGAVEHILSVVEAQVNPSFNLEKLILELHPTPAVAGIPKEKAIKWILENEPHDREYYSGFLGETGTHQRLYVNLRCLKLEGRGISLFVGGGFTKDSDLDAEWEETVVKSKTMMAVLQKMNNLAE
ncbi:MAG: chorismate-binding protein [Flavobacteriales bacterium]|nr:chorismate-binding protein [Flavobacteriales bacterium]